MATPTVSSATPDGGLTRGGEVIEIAGTNFRTVPTPPDGYLGGEEQQTVAVYFGDDRAPFAATVTDSLIHAKAPTYTGDYQTKQTVDGEQKVVDALPAAVDLRVVNLDDNGDPIVGEEATLAGGYEFRRVDLQQTGQAEQVIREFIEMLRRHIHRNTWWTMHRDYDSTPEDLLEYLQAKGLPLVRLQGPTWEEDRDRWIQEATPEDHPTEADQYIRNQRERCVIFEFVLDVWSNAEHPAELLNLSTAVVQMFHDLPWVTLEVNGEPWQWELDMPPDGHPVFDIGPNLDGLTNFRCTAMIKGIDISGAELAIIERGWTVSDPDSPKVEDEGLSL